MNQYAYRIGGEHDIWIVKHPANDRRVFFHQEMKNGERRLVEVPKQKAAGIRG